MPDTDSWTVGRLLEWTTDFLKQRGADSPRLDAEVLLAEARQCERIELYTAFHEDPGDQVRTAFRELVRRRAAGAPVAYLVGRREFYSLSFRVTPDVLIPRPETELLVLTLLELIKEHAADSPVDILDVGTGSGVIAVCAAKHIPAARLTAVDISPAALEIARDNAQRHSVDDRIQLHQSDLLAAVDGAHQFHFVVSNPPYVSDQEWEQTSPDVREHEPRIALAAGPTGAEIIQRLTPQAAERLHGDGWLILEISPMIEQSVHGAINADQRYHSPRTIKDLAGLPRVVTAQKRSD